MDNQEITINLDIPPSERWKFLLNHQKEVNDLLECYLNDLEGADEVFNIINLVKTEVIPQDFLAEIDFIASITKFTSDEVLIANLYYDILKLYLGCTAFACEDEAGILHARNLDWWTDNNLLSTHSRIFNFQRNGKTIFKTVGWLGFIGALSGIRPNSFSITLNAVSSSDKAELAVPVSFFIREVLDSCTSFDSAKKALESTTIASDCLLLLSGVSQGELAVIERTPSRFATRLPKNNSITVTNNYTILKNQSSPESILQNTSCYRFNRVEALLKTHFPLTPQDCISILQDPDIMMGITVQQMVFSTKTGEILLKKMPAPNPS